MRHAVVAIAILLAQAAPKPTFEVAAIKRNTSVEPGGTLGLLPGGRFRALNFPARALVGVAYRTMPPRQLDKSQIIGAPDWMETDRYDINAKILPDLAATIDAPGRDPNLMPKLLQSLLEDRFELKMHYEQREIPVFALVLAKKDGTLGPNLKASTVDCEKDRAKCRMQFLPGHVVMVATTMETLATSLSNPSGRLVFDHTALSGKFDIDLEWADETGSDKPSIFAAVQEQLGLKLESTRQSVDVVVIDHVERPTED